MAVKSFHAVLHLQPGRVAALRDCLESLHNLEDLQLILPRFTLSRWGRLLGGIQFHRLDLLQTNAPHAVIAEFLVYHPGIAHLSIEACGPTRGPCPLDGTRLPTLRNVSGPVSCVMHLVSNNPVSRVTTCQVPPEDPVPVCALTPSLLESATNLTVLQLEISPTDFDALECLARDASTLAALKLTELHTPDLVVGHPSLWLDLVLVSRVTDFCWPKEGLERRKSMG